MHSPFSLKLLLLLLFLFLLLSFTDETLVDSLFQFVGHGSLSFGTFMANAINALAIYPEEQEKVFTEIIHEIGPGRQPLRVDKSYLPYTNAFIHECIRTSMFMLFMPSLQCTSMSFYVILFKGRLWSKI